MGEIEKSAMKSIDDAVDKVRPESSERLKAAHHAVVAVTAGETLPAIEGLMGPLREAIERKDYRMANRIVSRMSVHRSNLGHAIQLAAKVCGVNVYSMDDSDDDE